MEGLLHVHSDYSYDGKATLRELYDLCLEREFDFLLMAEHAEGFDEAKMEAYVRECKTLSDDRILILPGLEFGFDKYPALHLLGIGIREFFKVDNISKAVDEIHKQKGLAIIAHPSRNDHFVPEEIIDRIDGIEIWNAGYDSRYLPHHESLKLFSRLKDKNPTLIAFVGMDMHTTKKINNRKRTGALTLKIDGRYDNGKELLEGLKRGSFINNGAFMRFHSRHKTGLFVCWLIKIGRYFLHCADQVYWKLLANTK